MWEAWPLPAALALSSCMERAVALPQPLPGLRLKGVGVPQAPSRSAMHGEPLLLEMWCCEMFAQPKGCWRLAWERSKAWWGLWQGPGSRGKVAAAIQPQLVAVTEV